MLQRNCLLAPGPAVPRKQLQYISWAMILRGGGLFAGANFFSLGAWWHLLGGHREATPNLVSKKRSYSCVGGSSLLSSLGSLVSHCAMMQITWEVMQGKSLGNTAYSLIYNNLWRIILHNHDITIWDKTVFCSQCFSPYLKDDLNIEKQCWKGSCAGSCIFNLF